MSPRDCTENPHLEKYSQQRPTFLDRLNCYRIALRYISSVIDHFAVCIDVCAWYIQSLNFYES